MRSKRKPTSKICCDGEPEEKKPKGNIDKHKGRKQNDRPKVKKSKVNAYRNLLFQCTFLQTTVSKDMLEVTIRLEPEKNEINSRVLNSFIQGKVTCPPFSAEVTGLDKKGKNSKLKTSINLKIFADEITTNKDEPRKHVVVQNTPVKPVVSTNEKSLRKKISPKKLKKEVLICNSSKEQYDQHNDQTDKISSEPVIEKNASLDMNAAVSANGDDDDDDNNEDDIIDKSELLEGHFQDNTDKSHSENDEIESNTQPIQASNLKEETQQSEINYLNDEIQQNENDDTNETYHEKKIARMRSHRTRKSEKNNSENSKTQQTPDNDVKLQSEMNNGKRKTQENENNSTCEKCGRPKSSEKCVYCYGGKTGFECKPCDKLFVCEASLIDHKKVEHCAVCDEPKSDGKCDYCSENGFVCKPCDEVFACAADIIDHKAKVHKEREYECDCGAKFTKKFNLSRHQKYSHSAWDFACTICGKKYVDAYKLKIHMRIHTGERPYQCDTCGKSFTNKPGLSAHVRTHEGRNRFKCDQCGKSFFSKAYLDSHKASHTGHRQFICQVCGVGCLTSPHLTRHMWIHNKTRSHECDSCPRKFFTENELKKHQRVHTDDRPYKCVVCDKRFTMLGSHKRHMEMHGSVKLYNCDVCKKDFVTELQFRCHMKIHSGDKKYTCEQCGKRFLSSSGLRSHYETHLGLKSNVCDICGKSYRSAWYLKIHQKTHTGENLIQCHACGDWFTDPSYFKRHQKNFCKGNPVYCKVCNQGFPHNKALASHMGIHTGERPYGCEVCGKAFAKPESLSEHAKRHTTNKEFECKFCGRCCINANELRKHERRHSQKKVKSSLPDSLKPGNRNPSTNVLKTLEPQAGSSKMEMEVITEGSVAPEGQVITIPEKPDNGQMTQAEELAQSVQFIECPSDRIDPAVVEQGVIYARSMVSAQDQVVQQDSIHSNVVVNEEPHIEVYYVM